MTKNNRKKKSGRGGASIAALVVSLVLFTAVALIPFGFYEAGPGHALKESAKRAFHQITSDGSGTDSTAEGIRLSGELTGFDIAEVPAYSETAYVELNGGVPYFVDELDNEEHSEISSYEEYSWQDLLGRCSTAHACIGEDLMPTEPRGSIGMVKPTGWQTVRYDFIDGGYLYNRCHLLAYELTAENDNENNLITGTRYMNIEGMLPFENEVAAYVRSSGGHVFYRVTPIFEGSNLLASGVVIEGYSAEDDGAGICFCVFAYNVQPGIVIDYSNGDNWTE